MSNNSIVLIIAVVLALGIGIGTATIMQSNSSITIIEPMAPEAVSPTQEEAQVAFRAANKAYPDAKMKLGDCAKNNNGLGVICVVEYSLMPKYGGMQSAQVLFAKNNGAWQAVLVD
ncbi:hypothetical protein [Pseudochrobactrum sp. AO18b]|uniref:hypothetical protein n=1 Tax=Pseudochrobactrum sp. AO18b TaxID=1201036 RepID=UPI0003B5C94E|nr:hypothetical protein [Pseudochrobactrum sp. AO18b]